MKSTLILVSLVATAIASPVQLRQLHNDDTRSLRRSSPHLASTPHMPIVRQVIDDIDDETGAVDFENDEDNDGQTDNVDADDDNDGILDDVDPDDDNDGEPDVTDNLDRRQVVDDIDDETGAVDFENDKDNDGQTDDVDQDDVSTIISLSRFLVHYVLGCSRTYLQQVINKF